MSEQKPKKRTARKKPAKGSQTPKKTTAKRKYYRRRKPKKLTLTQKIKAFFKGLFS